MSAVPPELPGDAPVARVLMRKLRSTVLLTLDMRRTYWQRKRCGSACSSRVFVHAPSACGSQLCRPLCGFLCALLFPIFTFQFFKNSTSKMVCQLKTFCHVLQSWSKNVIIQNDVLGILHILFLFHRFEHLSSFCFFRILHINLCRFLGGHHDRRPVPA